MIHGYPEIYLDHAMGAMGEAFDYAVNDCHIPGTDFVRLFATSSVCARWENGEPMYLLGKSGIEIVKDILSETTGKAPKVEPSTAYRRSPEYWCGWVIAYYQWFSGRRFADIFRTVSYDTLLSLYPTLHEVDISHVTDTLERYMRSVPRETNLKQFRSRYGYSQSELSRASGVSLRSIQMFEQRNKDINKAQSETVLRLSKALGCRMEDLLEA